MPHGIDVTLAQTLIYHGGGYCFDYILSQRKKEEIHEHAFQDDFISEIRNKKEPYVCEIPFGFPKLDIFLKEVDKNANSGKRSIIYHISSLAVEQEWVKEIIEPTLSKILINFPDHRIVFRPMHIDHKNPIIERCVEMGKKHKNFYFSISDNYIHEYASAIAMVCHRPYTLHLFGLATGQNIFLCHPEHRPVTSNDPLFVSCKEDDLVEKINNHIKIEKNISYQDRIDHCLKSGIYNPGSSISYLVKNLRYILSGKKNREWKYYQLDSGISADMSTQITLHILSATPGDKTFVLLMEKYPTNPVYPLLVADSYSRVTWSQRFYFQVSLQAFHRLIKINEQNKDGEIAEQMRLWWMERGINTFHYLLEQSNADKYDLKINTADLIRYSDEIIDKHQQATFNNTSLQLIDPEIHKTIIRPGPVSLYYGGNLCKAFIERNIVRKEDIEFIVDPKSSRQKNVLYGHIIRSPDILHTRDTPIIICSHIKRSETYYQLKRRLGRGRKIYVLCHNKTSIRLLNLLDRL